MARKFHLIVKADAFFNPKGFKTSLLLSSWNY
jgi:hypothetical protein